LNAIPSYPSYFGWVALVVKSNAALGVTHVYQEKDIDVIMGIHIHQENFIHRLIQDAKEVCASFLWADINSLFNPHQSINFLWLLELLLDKSPRSSESSGTVVLASVLIITQRMKDE
jgi:hypothetical protein